MGKRTLTIIDHGRDDGFGRYTVESDGVRMFNVLRSKIPFLVNVWLEIRPTEPDYPDDREIACLRDALNKCIEIARYGDDSPDQQIVDVASSALKPERNAQVLEPLRTLINDFSRGIK